jgi:GNAT superfamily N-acetyltransferase
MAVSVVRTLERSQLASAAALLVAAGLVESQDDALEELIAYHAADPRLVVVVEENASTIGVGIGSFDGYRGMLRRVAVTEEWRTLGLGSWLAAELERRLLQRGARLLRVHVHDAETRRFWERQGYSPIELSYLGKDPFREAEPVSDGASARAASWSRNGYEISTERARLDLGVVHGFVRESYWATGIPRDVLERALEHSICFGLYDPEGGQCGFARVVTDRATAALLCDMFVLESHRGRGLGKWLVECALTHPELGGLRRWSLVTLDAQGLYGQFGFAPLERPTDHMVIERSPTELWPRGR